MATPEQMQQAVEAYAAHMNAGDLAGIVSLFAPDARVEDPVGSPPKIGHEALHEFFGLGISMGAQLHFDGPVRIVEQHAAFPFHVVLDWEGQKTRIDVIDIFTFDADGKVVEMRAFFGPGNMGAAPE